jgi:hypothetical protein
MTKNVYSAQQKYTQFTRLKSRVVGWKNSFLIKTDLESLTTLGLLFCSVEKKVFVGSALGLT